MVIADRKLNSLKTGIWLYFWLLIFEGALRKWVLPGLATPLLVVRDPIALWVLFQAFRYGFFKPSVYVNVIWGLMGLAFITTMLFGHGNLSVALFGARIFVIHFPLIFVIGKIFNKDDVVNLGKVLLWVSLLMTVIVALQFFSPQSAWINHGVRGDREGSGFSGAAGYFRVPGTFSFTNGISLFYGMVAAFVFYFWIENKNQIVPQWLLLAATFSLLAAIPLSISRTLLFEVVVTFMFSIISAYRNPKFMIRLVVVSLIGLVLILILNNFSFFQTSTMAFTERFTSANRSEGGVERIFIDRFLGGMLSAITSDQILPFWGLGLGMGTNAGAKLLTGNAVYLISEGEWGRLIGEMGTVLGLLMIMLRLGLALDLLKMGWAALSKKNTLPWLLFSYNFLLIIQGQLGQPTALGFTVLSTGLILSAFRESKVVSKID